MAVTIEGVFESDDAADGAIGRLEVLGVPGTDIRKTSSSSNVTVTAQVEERLAERAAGILGAKPRES